MKSEVPQGNLEQVSEYRKLAEEISKTADVARILRMSFERASGNASEEASRRQLLNVEEAEKARDALVMRGMEMTGMGSPVGADKVWHWESVYKKLMELDREK